MTQTESAPATGCDALLRRARELLGKDELVPASAAGWQAAVLAMGAYAGPDTDFPDAARKLVNERRGRGNAGEWAVSALALSDNIQYDWLDKDGVGRRLDDVQRLVILIKDIAEPPKSAADILRRAWDCMDNGALPVASEKGWEAALWTTKTYADIMGCKYRGDNHFDTVTRMLAKEEVGGRVAEVREVIKWEGNALNLRQTAAYCALYPNWLHAEFVAEDIDGVSKLAALIQELAVAKA